MSKPNPVIKKDLTSLRILLAEGDQINLAVIKHLLKKAGCTFDLAVSGSEILEKISQSDYDLVIIDLETQTIDAYQTTTKIKTNSNSKISKLPVLGITNNADIIDFEKYSEAGLNSYVLRPVKLNELISAIETVTVIESESGKNVTEPILNLNMLYATCGNPDIVNNILKLFIAQTPDNMNQLHEFIKNENWEGLGNLSHNMKSTYSLIGMPEIKKNFDEIENDCANQAIDVSKFKKYLSAIKEMNVKIITEMSKILLVDNSTMKH